MFAAPFEVSFNWRLVYTTSYICHTIIFTSKRKNMQKNHKPLRTVRKIARFTEEESLKMEKLIKKRKTNYTDFVRALVLREIGQ